MATYDTPDVGDARTVERTLVCAEIRDGVKYFKRKLFNGEWTDAKPAAIVAWEITEEWRNVIAEAIVELNALRATAAANPQSRIDMILGGRRAVVNRWIAEHDAILKSYCDALHARGLSPVASPFPPLT